MDGLAVAGFPPCHILNRGTSTATIKRRCAMKWACLVVVTFGLSAALAAPEIDDGKKDLEKMKGTWKAVSGETDGNPLPDEFLKSIQFTITGDKYTLKQMDDVEEGTLKLNAAKKPRAVAVTITKDR